MTALFDLLGKLGTIISVIGSAYAIERKYLTRSELQGLLGILLMKKEKDRYSLDFLNSAEFFNRLKSAQDNKNINTIEIMCSEIELKQFDLDKICLQCLVTETSQDMSAYNIAAESCFVFIWTNRGIMKIVSVMRSLVGATFDFVSINVIARNIFIAS